MNEEKPKDRALYLLSLLMIFIANFLLLPGAFILVILTVVAIIDKSFLLAVLFFALAILCVFLNRVIIKTDDHWEAKKKEEMEQNKNIEIVADDGRIGRLKFIYDSEEKVLKLSGKQLRTFNNDSAFDVISYDSDGKLFFEMDIINQIYTDEEMLVRNMRNALFEFCKKEGETINNSDPCRIKYKELIISWEKDNFYIELTGVYKRENDAIIITAGTMYGSDKYEYSANWRV